MNQSCSHNFKSPFRLILAVENSVCLHESVGAGHLIRVRRAACRGLVKPLKSLGSVLFTQFCKVSRVYGLPLSVFRFLRLPIALGYSGLLLGSASGLGLLTGLPNFIACVFKCDFDANCLYALPGECSGQRSDEYANGDFEGVFHG